MSMIVATIRVQRCFRAWYTALAEADRQVAALLVQAAVRGYLVRSENRDLEKGFRMVGILQCAMRQYLARRRFFKMLEMREQIAAVEILQEEWRSFRRKGRPVKSVPADQSPPIHSTTYQQKTTLRDRISLLEDQLRAKPVVEGWMCWQSTVKTDNSERLWFEVAPLPFLGEAVNETTARYLLSERAGELQFELNLRDVQALHFNPPNFSISTVDGEQYLFTALTGNEALRWAEG
jgi:hypothetical protein